MRAAPKEIPALSVADKTRFWSKVNKDGPTQNHMNSPCWTWLDHLDKNGYGSLKIGKSLFRAHRISFVINGGLFSDEKNCVLHICDYPTCVNPMHLKAGSNDENMAEMSTKGRACSGDSHWSRTCPESVPKGNLHHARINPENMCRGEKKSNAILSEKDVLEIREKLASKKWTQSKLAKDYNVKYSTIKNVARGRSWKHLFIRNPIPCPNVHIPTDGEKLVSEELFS